MDYEWGYSTLPPERRDEPNERDVSLEYEQAEELAWLEFRRGELDDRIGEIIADDPYNAVKIALFYTHGSLRDDANPPVCAIQDFKATVEYIIDQRRDELLEDML